MLLTFNRIRSLTYAIKLDLPVDHATFLDELKRQKWQPDNVVYGQTAMIYRYSVNWNEIDGKMLKSLQDWAADESTRKIMIDQLYTDPLFANIWTVDPETMFRATSMSGRFLKDLPGFHTDIHVDNRLLVAAGMIYFIDGDNADQSTTFFETADKKNPVRVSTGYAQGWIAANTHMSWHDGHNRSAQDRYSMILSLSLKI